MFAGLPKSRSVIRNEYADIDKKSLPIFEKVFAEGVVRLKINA